MNNIDNLIAYIKSEISGNNIALVKKVQVKDWMQMLKYEYDNYYDKWSDRDEVYIIVVRLYQVLDDIGEDRVIGIHTLLEYLKTSIFKYETFNEREMKLVTEFLVDTLLDCNWESAYNEELTEIFAN